MRRYDNSSRVEQIALERSGKPFCYGPTEKMKVVEVPDFPSLGKLTALRFIEWLGRNPEGVVSLPTGKTPEHFIKWTIHFLENWEKRAVQKELGGWGIEPGHKPKMNSYVFVQIDEFYPMNPAQENSFAHYIQRFYIKQFGFDRRKALLLDTWKVGAPAGRDLGFVFPSGEVDLSLRYRSPSSELEQLQYAAITAADQQAMEYEAKVRELGGIGFFLGGIGPDGHIGFNIRGSDHYVTTSLTQINYETAAAAATDLGGIEIARQKAVITIGLRTITCNPDAVAIVTAAGESKAKVVKDAVESGPSVLYPATSLQELDGARFYLTQGAAKLLVERRYQELAALPQLPYEAAEQILIDVAFQQKKPMAQLRDEDLAADRLGSLLVGQRGKPTNLISEAYADLSDRIARGLEPLRDCRFLHTAPHHDDIMLGYLPYMLHLVREPQSSHFFATLTSGFTSVTNGYTMGHLQNLDGYLDRGDFAGLLEEGYFAPHDPVARNRDVYQYLDGVAANSPEMQIEGEARRMLRNLVELTNETDVRTIRKEIKKYRDYFDSAYPGKKDPPFVQMLKGMIREWEEELLWSHLGFNCDHIFHLRLGFYTGDIFTPQPEWERDVKPVLALLERLDPDIITVALDPEASGPDTHYKVLQTISEALKAYLKSRRKKRVTIWGYRNVWYRFHPSEANLIVPVSMNSLAITRSAFHICFGSQRSASFPSYEYDGPFCDLAQKIWVEQFSVLKTCVGRDFFYNNASPRLRASRGLNFIKAMSPDEFFEQAQSLKKLMESQPQ